MKAGLRHLSKPNRGLAWLWSVFSRQLNVIRDHVNDLSLFGESPTSIALLLAYQYRQATGRKEAGLEIRNLIKTKVPQVQCHANPARSDRHLRWFFIIVRAYLDDLHAGRFIYRPGMACAQCDIRDWHCQAWRL